MIFGFRKGRPWLALFCACRFLPRLGFAFLIGLSALLSGPANAESAATAPASSGGIMVAGAVARATTIPGPVTLLEAISQAGGLTAQAYALGTVLLRPAPGGITSETCLARQRSWLSAQLATVPGLDQDWVSALADQVGRGRLVRVPVALAASSMETTAAQAVNLGEGDVLIIPPRPSTIAVVGEALAGTQQWRYEPGFRVEDYLAEYLQPATDQRALALYLPNGRLRELRLNYWNYQEQVVPPGSVIWMGATRRALAACGE